MNIRIEGWKYKHAAYSEKRQPGTEREMSHIRMKELESV